MTEERFDQISDIYERMADDARRRIVPAHLFDPKNEEHLEEARQYVETVIQQGDISARQLNRRTGIKPAAISAFINKKWKGKASTLYSTAAELARAVEMFLQQRDADETCISGSYVETRFVKEVESLAHYAVRRKKIVAFGAPAGAGKSTVLFALSQEVPGSILVTVRKTRSSVKGFLQLWARSLGLQEQGRAEDIQDRIVNCLLRSDRLVMIDEAHKLPAPTLDVMREVWDEVRIPMVLAGTPSFYQTLNTRRVGVNSAELMDQLASRVSMYRDLTAIEGSTPGDPDQLFTVEDIRKVFNRGKVRLVNGADDLLCRIANLPGRGCLRLCDDLVQKVRDIFQTEKIEPELLFNVFKIKEGGRVAQLVMDQAGASERKAVAAAG